VGLGGVIWLKKKGENTKKTLRSFAAALMRGKWLKQEFL